MLLDMTEVPAIDFTTARVIEAIITDTLNADREIYIVGLTDSVRNMLERQGVLKYLQQSHVIQQRLDALIEARRKITTNII